VGKQVAPIGNCTMYRIKHMQQAEVESPVAASAKAHARRAFVQFADVRKWGAYARYVHPVITFQRLIGPRREQPVDIAVLLAILLRARLAGFLPPPVVAGAVEEQP